MPELQETAAEIATLYADHANLRAAVDSLGINMCLIDEHARILWVNDTWRRFAIANGGDPNACQEGGDYLASIPAAPQDIELAIHRQELLALLSGQRSSLEFEYACHSDEERRWFLAHFRAFRANGRLRVLVVHENITARKLAEEARERATRTLLQLQRAWVPGAEVDRIAHDLNNLLTVITGNIELARRTNPRPAEDLLVAAHDGCRRARELVQQLAPHPQHRATASSIDLAQVADEILRMVRATMPATLQVRPQIQSVRVHAVPSQMHQVLLNLVTNARQAMRDCGTLTITLDRCGSSARLRVEDTGPGIDPAVRPHIFEPFVTTKAPGQGTGLGLAIVQAIVLDHGGSVEVASEPGRGAQFTVLLPVAADAAS